MRREVREARKAAIREALTHLEDGMAVALGAGTTVEQLVEELAVKLREERLDIVLIPSSLQSQELILAHGLRMATLHEYPRPDLALDSFDQVDPEGNAIKGGGAALLREKVIAQASEKVIYVGDHGKIAERLDKPVPVEVLEYAFPHVRRVVESWGYRVEARRSGGKMGPVISDNGNLIADVSLGAIEDPLEADMRLREIAGLLETGIFPRLCDLVLIGYPDGRVRRIRVERRRL